MCSASLAVVCFFSSSYSSQLSACLDYRGGEGEKAREIRTDGKLNVFCIMGGIL